MLIKARLYGWFKTGVADPEGVIEMSVPVGTDVAGLGESIRDVAPLFDARASMIMIDGGQVELERTLVDGEEVHFYPIFSGG